MQGFGAQLRLAFSGPGFRSLKVILISSVILNNQTRQLQFANLFVDPKAQEFVRLLKAAGWSQAEAARRLHITAGAVSQICSGKTRPRPSTLNLLRVLLLSEGAAAGREVLLGPGLEPWGRELVAALRGLPERQREWVLAVVKQMIRTMPARRQGRSNVRV